MTEKDTEAPMYLVPGRLTYTQRDRFYHAVNCAQPLEKAIATIGTVIQPCADIETVCYGAADDMPLEIHGRDPRLPVYSDVCSKSGEEYILPLVRRTDMEVQVAKVREDAMRQGYLLGFNSATEGWNGEYPFKDKAQSPDEDADWLQDRDDNIRAALKEGEAA
ncbi:hypothetical protein [Komagataeibacter diospyri]|uniref:Uncharacterized protein n=1 Tax=Komagataeibacter diospyri TaxID=1932662 RepID=A0A4P5NU12_9PROT|nr:hypothetical protein [Komagataeibacter diospyri]GCE83025.1 hypothetical protein MSKU9_1166 [Komagataeibacter diospyri]